MKLRILLLIIIVSLSFFQSNAQLRSSDYQLGMEYMQNQEFEKAVFYFEKLIVRHPKSSLYFKYYIQCLTSLEEFDEAEKHIKRRLRKDKSNYTYSIELGYLYKLKGELKKSEDQYQKTIDFIRTDQHYIIRLANAFRNKREYEYAEKVYLEGRKLMKGEYTFNFELGSLYYYQRNYTKMIEEYLDMLIVSEAYLQNVQNRLQSSVYNDIDGSLKEILLNQLLIRSQKYSDKDVFNELLIWLYIQDKDFEGAFIQAKALDKRKKEDGSRIISLAKMVSNNEEWTLALKAYQYTIDKGNRYPYYNTARQNYFNVNYLQIINQYQSIPKLQIEELAKSIEEFISEVGKSDETVNTIIQLAHLYAFYLDNSEKAIKILLEISSNPGISVMNKSEAELELADAYVLHNEVYEATLIYARVEENNKNNPTGYEAKFRRGRLAYYIGNFEWAKALLDVLKASTSKLIANDAMGLSIVMRDNILEDSLNSPLLLFSNAELLSYQKKDSLAIITLDSIINKYHSHSIVDEALFKKADIYNRNKNYVEAADFLQQIVDNYAYDILGDDALIKLAYIYQNHLGNTEKAKELYQKFLLDYPASIYSVEARKQFRILRGDKISGNK